MRRRANPEFRCSQIAAETDASVKSPSPKKATGKQEAATGVPPLPLDKKRANETLDDEGAPGRQRKSRPGGPAPKSAYKSPELLKGEDEKFAAHIRRIAAAEAAVPA